MNRVDTVIATTDQLQAEIGGLARELILVYMMLLGMALLYMVLAWKVNKLSR